MTLTDEHVIGIVAFLVGIIASGIPAYIVVFGKLSHINGQLEQLMRRLDFVDKNTEEIGKVKQVVSKHTQDLNELHARVKKITVPPRSIT